LAIPVLPIVKRGERARGTGRRADRSCRRVVSPFTLYRGATKIMAVDLAGTPTAGLDVQPCGGAHLSNSGRPPLPSAAGVRRQRPDRRPTGGPFTSNSRNTATLQDDRRHPLERFEIVGIASIQAGRRRSSTDGASDLEIVDIRQSTPVAFGSHFAWCAGTAHSCLLLPAPADFDQFQAQALHAVDYAVQRGLVRHGAAQDRPDRSEPRTQERSS